MDTLIKKCDDLDVETKESVSKIISDEFGHVPIVKKYEWAIPDWAIILYSSTKISSIAQVITRTVEFDSKKLKIGGLSNLITLKAFRGLGMADEVLKSFENLIFHELNCDLGLLLCADDLVSYYKKYGWIQVHSDLYFDQPSGKQKWTANVMLISKEPLVAEPKTIDLNGLPW
jgi:hypothetical protein